MATLVSQIQALIDYANGVTSKSDTKLGDAVKSLADNYGNSGDSSLPDNYDELGTLSAQIQALITYANSVDGQSDTHIGDAMRHLADGTPQWMLDAVETYGIPLQNLKDAYAIDPYIKLSFDGTDRWLIGDGVSYIDTGIHPTTSDTLDITFRFNKSLTQQRILGPSDTSVDYGFNLYQNGSGYFAANFQPVSGSGWSQIGGSPTVSSSLGKKIRIIYNKNSTISLYVDGALKGTNNLTLKGETQTGTLCLLYYAGGKTASIADVNKLIVSDSHYYIPIAHPTLGNTLYDLIVGETLTPNGNGFTIK